MRDFFVRLLVNGEVPILAGVPVWPKPTLTLSA